MAERRVPRIRFKGFEEDWEQRKLGELADIVGGGTPSTSNLQYWDGDIDWYAPAEINEQVYISSSQKKITKAGYENSSVKLLPVGTVLFTSRAGIGKTAILDREACTNQGFQSIVPHKQELDSYFIFSRSAELKQYGEIVGAGSTFVEVSGKQMSEMELMMPLALNEQQAIGTYFRRLDQLLSLHQRKLEKLKILKKAMLEKMFPKNGAKVPEIRFSGFTDDWEQRELGKFAAETRGGGTPTTSNRTYWNGDIPWIQSSDLKEDELFEVKPRKYVSNIGLSRSATQLVEANSIAVVTRVGVGKLALMPNSYTTSQDFVSLSRLQVAPYFAVYSIYHMLQEELQVVQGTSIKGMTKEDLLSKSLLIPVDIGEQTRLGCLFYKIDSLLSLHQRKLEKLRQIKKSMLERMFV